MGRSTATPPRVVVDSSVFFSAAYSITGAAHDLLVAAIPGRVIVFVSDYVLEETERNLLTGAPHGHPAFQELRATIPFRRSNPSRALIADTERVVVAKDAPVIAAARAAQVTVVATYDRKDLLSKREEILAAFGVTVATPGEILASL